jgi:hypothetical protein
MDKAEKDIILDGALLWVRDRERWAAKRAGL